MSVKGERASVPGVLEGASRSSRSSRTRVTVLAVGRGGEGGGLRNKKWKRKKIGDILGFASRSGVEGGGIPAATGRCLTLGLAMQVFRAYAMKHAQSWYQFINGDLHHWQMGLSESYRENRRGFKGLLVVIDLPVFPVRFRKALSKVITKIGLLRHIKSTSWSIAVVKNLADEVTSFKGPRHSPEEESWRTNQTVFPRGFKVALSSRLFKGSLKVLSGDNSRWADLALRSTSVASPQPRSGHSATTDLPQIPGTSSGGHSENEH
ncbi:hypothetical protein DFH09DRAFT_1080663 [Mycena vulgaris]|nr:hypothetical protein DFH09DRAFT_1080663 [Mycena vulgaris]